MEQEFIYSPPSDAIEVIYQDKDVLVAHKPAGLLSVPGRGDNLKDSMLSRLQAIEPKVRIVHRLDMDTSGIMIFALRKKAEVSLRRQFQDRKVKKVYQAVVQGILTEKEGVIDAPLAPHPDQKLRHQVFEAGKASQTEYKVLAEGDDCSLVELRPITGRSHQLRVHLLHIGHSVLGDRFYAPEDVLARGERLMLHAETVSFFQPYLKEEMSFSIPSGFAV